MPPELAALRPPRSAFESLGDGGPVAELLGRFSSGVYGGLCSGGDAVAMASPVAGPVVAAAENDGATRALAVGVAIAEGAAVTLAAIELAEGDDGGKGPEIRLVLRPVGVALRGTY